MSPSNTSVMQLNKQKSRHLFHIWLLQDYLFHNSIVDKCYKGFQNPILLCKANSCSSFQADVPKNCCYSNNNPNQGRFISKFSIKTTAKIRENNIPSKVHRNGLHLHLSSNQHKINTCVINKLIIHKYCIVSVLKNTSIRSLKYLTCQLWNIRLRKYLFKLNIMISL